MGKGHIKTSYYYYYYSKPLVDLAPFTLDTRERFGNIKLTLYTTLYSDLHNQHKSQWQKLGLLFQE